MGKIIYIKGTLVINTPYFKLKEAGCLYETPPEGAEIWEPNKGDAIFEINDNNPQSIFNEYYAEGGLTLCYQGAEFLYKTYKGVYDDYKERIVDLKSIININTESDKHQQILFRLLYLSVIASLETFVSDIIITKITECEESFERYYKDFIQENKQEKLEKWLSKGWVGKREQEIIDHAQRLSYSDIKMIKKSFKKIFDLKIEYNTDNIKKHIEKRHIIAHKNGRTKDNKYLTFNESDLNILISDTDNFVDYIMSTIDV